MRILTLFLASWISAAAFSQDKIVPAYLLLPTSDTLHGEVVEKSIKTLNRSVLFRESAEGDFKEYRPHELQGFKIIGSEKYSSTPITYLRKKGNNGNRYDSDGTSRDTIQAHLFVNVIVEGEISLFKLYDEVNLERFFVQKDGGKIHELEIIERDVYKEVAGKTFKNGFTTIERYKGILKSLMFDCPAMQSQIEKTQLEQHSLSNLMLAYSKCKGTETVSHKEGLKMDIKLGLLAGWSFVKLNTDKLVITDGQLNEELGTSPAFGANVNFKFRTISDNISLKLGFAYYSMTAEYDWEGVLNEDGYQRFGEGSLEVTAIQLPVCLQYNIMAEKKLSPYVYMGTEYVDYDLAKDEANTWFEDSGVPSEPRQKRMTEKFSPKKTISFVGGLGMHYDFDKIGALIVESRYIAGRDLLDPSSGQKMKASGVQLMVGYEF